MVGGTKGNLILDYVSAAPNKAKVTKVAPNIFDYDELTKYGYGNLVTRIMNAGGRFKMYDLVGLTPPPSRDDSTSSETYTVDAPIVLDRVGEESRYQGLKLGQAFDDESQGEALLEYQRKISNGERPSLSKVKEEVDAYVLPFADKRNVGPRQTPDWTAEKLDEWGRQQGRVESWARQAKEGAFVKDPLENFDSISPFQRAYGLSTALITAVAFGKATPNFVQIVFPNDKDFFGHLIHVAQLPAVIMVLLSLASSAYGIFTATNLNRSQYVWAVKGLLGGPLIVRQLAELPNLVTLQEQQKREEEALGIS